MKLFIVATLVAIASAGRLEHLERSYLPPDQGSSAGHFGSHSSFGSQGSFGGSSHGGHGGFNSGFESNGIETPSAGVRSSGSLGSSSFPGATINQYLPPDHGPSGASGAQFSGSLQGFGNQQSHHAPQSSFGSASQYSAQPSSQYSAQPSSQYSAHPSSQYSAHPSSQYSAQPSSHYGAPSTFGAQSRYQTGGSQFGSQGLHGSNQFAATSRQYLAPKSSSNYPQQSFDEQTGYHY